MAQPIYLDPELQGIERERQLAQALQQRGMKPLEGQVVGNRFIAPSWTQHLANLYDVYSGGQRMAEAEKKSQAYADALRQLGAKEPDGMLNTLIKQGRLMDAYKFSQDRMKALQHAEDMVLKKREQGAKATQQAFMAQRAVNALGGVASALENIGQLPAGTTTQVLPNLTTKDGMTNFVQIGRAHV